MKIGAGRVQITPDVGMELSGFLARQQPSTSVLDPLFAKALFIEHEGQRLLWLHADILGFDRPFVARFREWVAEHLQVRADHILLSATHTHSGPTQYELINCGRRDAKYVEILFERMTTVAKWAADLVEPAKLVTAVDQLSLAIDRRKKASAHTDPRVTGVGFRRADGTFIAAILNYAMHPVALGARNRAISADWCGHAAARAAEILPGNPIVLMTNGAAGNINPPSENVSVDQVRTWGYAVADAIAPKLAHASADEPALAVRSCDVLMPLEIWNESQIDAAAQKQIGAVKLPEGWGARYVDAIRTWQHNRKAALAHGVKDKTEIEIQVVRLGPLTFVTAAGEFFSRYADLIREESGKDVHIIGYANGNFGYVATSAAYDEGGYEIDSAHFFYNTFRARRGAFEQLARDAGKLVRQL
ncbi:MAG TPA: hypothetical protein VL282_11795 [Tepidisphaeraceae bacterium]|nr:hypothetical protein [Tepidisphaeraceae bacterium]